MYCHVSLKALFRFQLTRSVGSVTYSFASNVGGKTNFNSHAPWGAWPTGRLKGSIVSHFNSHAPWGAWPLYNSTVVIDSHAPWGAWLILTVSSIKKDNISTHTLRGERDSTYCICEVTPPQQSGHFTKNHFKKRYFLHNMYYIFSEPPYKTNITARSLTKSNCPQDHMFPLHLYAPLSSSNYYPDNRIEGYLVLHQ